MRYTKYDLKREAEYARINEVSCAACFPTKYYPLPSDLVYGGPCDKGPTQATRK